MVDNLPIKFDADARHRFLQYYALTGQIQKSAREIGISPATVRRVAKQDPAFKEAMEEAKQDFVEAMEREVVRRAVMGVDEPVFQQGEQVGEVRKYSDALLMMLMKKLDPTYKEKHQIDVSLGGGILAVPAQEAEDEWEKRNSIDADYAVVDEEEPDAEND